MDTMQITKTVVDIDSKRKEVHILAMKFTPSMKNVVYSVYIIFITDGKYVPKLSKCDCPNGWLFFSQMLACFVFMYLIQKRSDWTF